MSLLMCCAKQEETLNSNYTASQSEVTSIAASWAQDLCAAGTGAVHLN